MKNSILSHIVLAVIVHQVKSFMVTLYNKGALISINSCLTNAQIILN